MPLCVCVCVCRELHTVYFCLFACVDESLICIITIPFLSQCLDCCKAVVYGPHQSASMHVVVGDALKQHRLL